MQQEHYVRTRRALHGVAELVIAGPQYRAHGSIKLKATDGGFGGVAMPLRVDGGELVWDGDWLSLAQSCRDLARAAGLEVGAPGNYPDASGVDPDEPLAVDPAAAALVADLFARGSSACRALAPDKQPVLWPEHFDLGISLDEVNYGVSPGDVENPFPYAYVGPWKPQEGQFWNASFGARRTADELPDADAIAAFFEQGRAEVRRPDPR